MRHFHPVGLFCAINAQLAIAKEWRSSIPAFSPDMYESGAVMQKIMHSKFVISPVVLSRAYANAVTERLGRSPKSRHV